MWWDKSLILNFFQCVLVIRVFSSFQDKDENYDFVAVNQDELQAEPEEEDEDEEEAEDGDDDDEEEEEEEEVEEEEEEEEEEEQEQQNRRQQQQDNHEEDDEQLEQVQEEIEEQPQYLRENIPLSATDKDIQITKQKMSFAESALEIIRVSFSFPSGRNFFLR